MRGACAPYIFFGVCLLNRVAVVPDADTELAQSAFKFPITLFAVWKNK